ncbi:DUF1854 domain-containing protein [Bordetella parapertussis]|uniref:DUF1854 domain-containing protein n=6 Tax=Bordetella TaxID=517 RepID=K0MKV4_BORPB|nr:MULTISPECIES: DUF1854 domain-containing protein [Bordetella]SHS84983.1 Domain of uncharacterised function (DUF1854) [Mycobacteroides abscessus subsp. abscessus]AMG89668.2 DUF1854 domain-containing protein [Bordetella bronchiseptica]AUL44174.1 hypothetical protein BTL54_16135 [Bordetella parapertussis]AWP64078.1 hypothetical protein B7P06_16150 [Bordetella parapertussis]AWP71582.1 hypothetical protein B7O99_16140 [Bordetella parapertussis]
MRAQPAMNHCAFQLHRNQAGRLVFTGADGRAHEGVVPVRAFPISAPASGLSLVSADGHELAWLDDVAQLPPAQRQLVEAELASREFMPEIRRIVSVSTFATPSSWQVETDRGNATFVLRGEEDIRRLAGHTLLITDMHGIFFLIRDALALDRHSRKLLDRFL